MIYLFILEDITAETHRHRDWETPGGVGPLAESMFMGQKLGMGVACVSHTLSGLSPIIRQNIRIWLVFGLPGEEPQLICNTLRATPEEADRIKGLMPGEMVLYNPAIIERPVYAKFEQLKLPGQLEELSRRQMVEDFLEEVKASAPVDLDAFKLSIPVKTETKDRHCSIEQKLSALDIEMLMRSSTGVRKPVCKIYNEMGLSRAQGRRITKRLESIGTIIPHNLPTGKPGGRLCFYETTEYGWEILTKRGINKPKSKTNGTFVHELAVNLIEAWERKRSRAFRCEVNVGGKRLDCESTDKTTGAKTIWNIGVSDPVREAESIEAILKLPVVQTSNFVFVARNTRFAKEVSKLLTDKDPSGELLSRVEIKTIADFVEV